MFLRLFIAALWSPAEKELISWLSFCDVCVFVTFPYVILAWSGVVLDCIDSCFFSNFITLMMKKSFIKFCNLGPGTISFNICNAF